MADRRYETLVLLHPDLGEPGAKELAERVKKLIEDQGGTVGQVQEWGFRRRGMGRRKVCRFCADKTMLIDYKDSRVLGTFLSERGKIIPSRITGNCASHQRHLTLAIKRARTVALLPFTAAYP